MRRWLSYGVSVAALVAVYVITGRLGLHLAGIAGHATPVWPPAGIALAALVLGGPRLWPGVFLGAFLTNYTTGIDLVPALLVGAGNTAESVVGAYLLRSSGFEPSFQRLGDVASLVLFAAAFSTMIAATIGAPIMALFHQPNSDWANLPDSWWTWWLGDATGVLVIAPAILAWASRLRITSTPWWRILEAAAVAAALATLTLITFSEFVPPPSLRSFPVAYTTFLPLIWMALRFDVRGAATAAMIVDAVAVYAVARNAGPFTAGGVGDAFLLTAGFAATASLTGLVISAGISERNVANALLAEQKTAAEAASRAKDRFFAALSHELRTPLTPVISSLDLLRDDPNLRIESREILEVARRNAELEAKLIDDLLDVNRIERGKVNLRTTTTDVHSVVEVAARSLEAGMRLKRIGLTLELRAASHYVDADPARLQQVLWNLLQNAIKFTADGGAIIVRSFNCGDRNDRIVIEVSDNGIGIEPDVLPRLFTAFEQGDTTITRQYGGLGLGLSIAKALLDAHAGTISVRSDGHGRGATFTIELATVLAPSAAPMAPARSIPSPSTPVAPASRQIQSPRILLVDDHRDTLRTLRTLLRRGGYDVLTADNLTAARETIERERFDLLISDIGLPDGSGLDVVRALRVAQQHVPAIALSGYGMDDDIRRSHDAGFQMHLTKPVDAETLETAVAQLLHNGKRDEATMTKGINLSS